MFYFREGANFASVYTQSKILSENIKWNLNQKTQKIFSLIINTSNANSFTGEQGYKSMQHIADIVSKQLTDKQKEDEDDPIIVKPKNIIFGCTGMLGCADALKNKLLEKGYDVPVIDPIPLAVQTAYTCAKLKLSQSKHSYPMPPEKGMVGFGEPKIKLAKG